ncbi:hypothetical protein [Novosphingobium sp. Gsoil 351]|uniref:hypothetical protein n=1 Tax=Novosphingobium sp. Gsoil 351 TaxID=2675225 RepID=UPI0012B4AC34|nr:hypothetical protein [Novosphingobium sp. Gsoil 351]QGN54139.1 hypothetical protein GKE62_05860 [Novosphingobium sp. Gsoil 351]
MSAKAVVGMIATGAAILALGLGGLIAMRPPEIPAGRAAGLVQIGPANPPAWSPLPLATPFAAADPASTKAPDGATSAGVWSTPAEFAPPD